MGRPVCIQAGARESQLSSVKPRNRPVDVNCSRLLLLCIDISGYECPPSHYCIGQGGNWIAAWDQYSMESELQRWRGDMATSSSGHIRDQFSVLLFEWVGDLVFSFSSAPPPPQTTCAWIGHKQQDIWGMKHCMECIVYVRVKCIGFWRTLSRTRKHYLFTSFDHQWRMQWCDCHFCRRVGGEWWWCVYV
jgi:hypothetical protein